ncbi:hypothetical protein [Azospirillum melinis]
MLTPTTSVTPANHPYLRPLVVRQPFAFHPGQPARVALSAGRQAGHASMAYPGPLDAAKPNRS